MTGKEIRKTADIVLEILTDFPQTRDSDDFLYIKVCELLNPEVLTEEFWYVHARLKDFGLPAFETVRRTRQKIQAENPELAGSRSVTEKRKQNEEVYREFARG